MNIRKKIGEAIHDPTKNLSQTTKAILTFGIMAPKIASEMAFYKKTHPLYRGKLLPENLVMLGATAAIVRYFDPFSLFRRKDADKNHTQGMHLGNRR